MLHRHTLLHYLSVHNQNGKYKQLQRLLAITFWLLLLLVVPLFLHAQKGPEIPLSNIRIKKLALGKTDTLRVDSMSLAPGSVVIYGAQPVDYTVFPERSLIVWKHKPATDSVQLRYRVLPLAFHQKYAHKTSKSIDSNFVFYVYHQDINNRPGSKNFVDFNQIDYNGSYGRSISLGNNQDVVLNSHFNLQVNGYLLDSIKLEAALTDNSIPFQPEGNTQRLQEFDQIYIRLRKNKHDLMLGDLALDKPPGYFLNFYKRVQGAFYQDEFRIGKNTTNKLGLSGSIAKGQFARNIFNGQEGNQGPYKLTGNNGEQFFIVLAGTEKVYINDKHMERGENADYTINYNTGEITFMARQLITKDSRIQVEFEYQDKNYLNSLIYAYDEVQVNKKWNVRLNAYSNQDAKNQPYLQNLTGDQKRFLGTIGDSIQNAYYPVITKDTFSASKILYKIVDSTVNGTHYDTVLVYSINPDSAIYNVAFSYVGEGKGDYVIAATNANGRVYNWVPPTNGHHNGDYLPVQLIVTPKKTQVFTLSNTYAIDSFKTLNVELAASNVDPNLFSNVNNNTHWGLASRVLYTEKRLLGEKDSAGHRRWNWQNNVSWEYVQDRFQAIAPYRNAEFNRDWNIPQTTVKPDEQLVNFSTRMDEHKLGSLGYTFGYFQRGSDYKGFRNVVDYTYTGKKVNVGFVSNLLQATDTFQKSVYFRPSAFAEYKIEPLKNAALGVRIDAEHDAITDKITDTLRNTAFAFDRTSAYLRSNGLRTLQYSVEYGLRRDQLPRNNEFIQQSHSHNVDVRLGISKWKNHQINFTGSYRKLLVDDTTFNTQKPEESLLGRLTYTGNMFKHAVSLNTLYEFGSGQQQKLAYTYVEVPAGQGVYTWIDYNGDGVQQSNEFEVALYTDQKKFIRVFTPTNEYVKVNYVNLNQSINLEPSYLWIKAVHNWQKFLSRFSDQASIQISNRLLSDAGFGAYNPFLNTQKDANIIITSTSVNNSIYFNRTNAKWGLDYNYFYNAGKQLLTYGVEGNTSTQQLLKLRWNLNKSLTLNFTGKEGGKSYQSALSDGRTYNVSIYSGEPAFTWLHRSVWRATVSLKYEQRQNEQQYGGELATISGGSFELRWTQPVTGAIQIRGTYSGINYNGLPTAPVTFIMIDGLQNGSNYLWYLNWERKVSKGIEVSLEYEGRKPGNGDIIHTGRMTVKAIL
ncbi:hypothetical protein ACTHGU_20610 [Chitinophagaceae bacterium MMS25-I14]